MSNPKRSRIQGKAKGPARSFGGGHNVAAARSPDPVVEAPRVRARAEPSPLADLLKRFPIGRRDGTLLLVLAALGFGGFLVKLAVSAGGDSAELVPLRAVARRAFPDVDDATAMKKLTEKLEAQYPAAPPPDAVGPRGVTSVQRAAMLAKLKEASSADKKAWFSVQANNPEAASFQKWLSAVFEEAGWKVESGTWPAGSLKPGMFFFAADEKEKSPEYVTTAHDALDAAGLKMTVALGYRSYFDEMRKTKPEWSGLDMKPDQAFAIVIGRKEDPAAAPAP